MRNLIETLNSTENHKNVIPSSVSKNSSLLLRRVISVMNILGKKAKCHTTFFYDENFKANDVYVSTSSAIKFKDLVKINDVLGTNDVLIIPKQDELFIKINQD